MSGKPIRNGVVRVRIVLKESHILWQFYYFLAVSILVVIVFPLLVGREPVGLFRELRVHEKSLILYRWGESWGPSTYFSNSGQLFALVGGFLAFAAVSSSQFGSIADRLGHSLTERRKSRWLAGAMVLLCWLVILLNVIWGVVPRSFSDLIFVFGGLCFSVLSLISPWVLVAVVHVPIADKIEDRLERKKMEWTNLLVEYSQKLGYKVSFRYGDEVAELCPRQVAHPSAVLALYILVAIVAVLLYLRKYLGWIGCLLEMRIVWLFLVLLVGVALFSVFTALVVTFIRGMYVFLVLADIGFRKRGELRQDEGGVKGKLAKTKVAFFGAAVMYVLPLVLALCVFAYNVSETTGFSVLWSILICIFSLLGYSALSIWLLACFAGGFNRFCHPLQAHLPKRVILCGKEILELSEQVNFRKCH